MFIDPSKYSRSNGALPIEVIAPKLIMCDRFIKDLKRYYENESNRVIDAINSGLSSESGSDDIKEIIYAVMHDQEHIDKFYEHIADTYNPEEPDDETYVYFINIVGYCGIYYIDAEDYDVVGYFSSRDLAVQFIFNNWPYVR